MKAKAGTPKSPTAACRREHPEKTGDDILWKKLNLRYMEYKESWRDEYLKWICGFANTQGGRLSMVISNTCILPENWTVETFMQAHNSRPYNPDIAGVFYRAGYIERWGRGIETICNACKELGAELPVYELLGNTLRVHFKALPETIIDDVGENEKLNAKNVGINEQKILELIAGTPKITATTVAEKLGLGQRQAERLFSRLKDKGLIERIGARKNGYWKIKEN